MLRAIVLANIEVNDVHNLCTPLSDTGLSSSQQKISTFEFGLY